MRQLSAPCPVWARQLGLVAKVRAIAEFVERIKWGQIKWGQTPLLIPQATLDGWQAEGLLELLGQVSDMAALFASVDMVLLPSYGELVGYQDGKNFTK